MKKIVVLIILFILVESFLCAEYVSEDMTKDFTLQAGYGTVLQIEMEEIPAQTNLYVAGMPFNIEDFQVQYAETEHGREIATWRLLSNTTDFRLSITGEPLYWTGDSTKQTGVLDFILNIQYVLGYYLPDGSISSNNVRWIEYRTEDEQPFVVNLLEGVQVAKDTFIGSVNGSVFFEFTPSSSQSILNDMENTDAESTYPPGNYVADVIFKLEVI